MARTQHSGALQFSDLPLWGKVGFVAAAAVIVASGFLLPKWVTVVAIAAAFGVGFVVQRRLPRRD